MYLGSRQSGFAWPAIYDPLDRRLTTTISVITDGRAPASLPEIINQYCYRLFRFLELIAERIASTMRQDIGA
jgi:hypothetical protein